MSLKNLLHLIIILSFVTLGTNVAIRVQSLIIIVPVAILLVLMAGYLVSIALKRTQ
ncbi:amino acid permease [Fictibacillus halophilus]|uniref:Amino acid permease n=1 Tax=Fictibacillus halophilus TaxID=1610490 RepID=A0ABV2LEM9_9BACL|nr:hypothetical protein [Fictibacillus halophilus]